MGLEMREKKGKRTKVVVVVGGKKEMREFSPPSRSVYEFWDVNQRPQRQNDAASIRPKYLSAPNRKQDEELTGCILPAFLPTTIVSSRPKKSEIDTQMSENGSAAVENIAEVPNTPSPRPASAENATLGSITQDNGHASQMYVFRGPVQRTKLNHLSSYSRNLPQAQPETTQTVPHHTVHPVCRAHAINLVS